MRGHHVRALIRHHAHGHDLASGTDVHFADLRFDDLAPAVDGIEVIVHLAARVEGSYRAQMADTIVGTERLVRAMAKSPVRHLILASSISVYDWTAVRGELTESSPLERDLYRRDTYAIAKTWQERVVRRCSREHDWDFSILRPGFIWGPGHAYLAGLGQTLGRWHMVVGPATRPALTYVENCADCFTEAVENRRAIGETFNVVDGHNVSVWRYLGEYLRRTGSSGLRVPVPYRLGLTAAQLAEWINERHWHGRARLPGLLVPRRFRSRFVSVPVSTRKLGDVLGWHPPFDFAQCLERTYSIADPSAAWLAPR